MRKRTLGKLLSIVMAAAMVLTSAVPSRAYAGLLDDDDAIVLQDEEAGEDDVEIVDEDTDDESIVSLMEDAPIVEEPYQDGSVERREYALSDLNLENPVESIKVEVPKQDFVFFEKEAYEMPVSKLQKDDIAVIEPSDDEDELDLNYDGEDKGKSEKNGRIIGTLLKVPEWTAYGDDMKSGHFLALKITAPGAAKIEAGADSLYALDEDGTIAIRIRDKNNQQVKVKVTYENGEEVTKTYDIKCLELEGFKLDVDIAESKDLFGKTIGDLHSDVNIEKDAFTGTLKYVDDYSSAFGEGMDSGCYLAVHTDIDAEKGEEAYIVSSSGTEYQFDRNEGEAPDGVMVLYIPYGADLSGKSISLKKVYKSGAFEIRKYDLSNLEFENLANRINVTAPDNISFGEAFGYYRPTDIQREVRVYEDDDYEDENCIFGKLKFVENWKAYGKGLSTGHYLAVKVNAPGAKKLVVSVVNGDGNDADITNDPDKTAVLRIRNKDEQKIRVTATFIDGNEAVREYWLDDLELENFAVDTKAKDAAKYQENLDIEYGYIDGTVFYVEDETHKGNYLALHTDLKTGEKATITFKGQSTAFDDAGNAYVKIEGPVDDNIDFITFTKTYKDESVEARNYYFDYIEFMVKDQVKVIYDLGYDYEEEVYPPDDEVLSKGQKATRPDDPERYGYKFAGWFEEDTTVPFDFDKAVDETGVIILKAGWTPVTYTVRFNENGGVAPKEAVTQEFTYDVRQALKANTFTREGYEFAGWAIDAEAKDDIKFTDKQVVANLSDTDKEVVNFYAVWTEKHAHSWNAAWTWNENNTKATLTLTCGEEVLKFAVDTAYSEEWISYGVCRRSYYAECIYNGSKYSDSRTFLVKDGKVQELDDKTLGYTGNNEYLVFNGKAQKLSNLKIYWGESLLVEKKDYTLKYSNNKNAGTATVLVKGTGQFENSFTETIEFTISKADISWTDFSANDINIYSDQKVSVPRLMRGKTVVGSKFYTVTYPAGISQGATNVAPGKYEITIAGDGENYTGKRTVTLNVADRKNNEIAINKISIKIKCKDKITPEQVDDREGYIPEITIKKGKDILVSTAEKRYDGKDFDDMFDVKLFNNNDAGEAYAIITALDGCVIGGKKVVGSIKKNFKIKGTKFSSAQKAELNVIKNKKVHYTGEKYTLYRITEALEIDYAPSLEIYRDYTASFENNINKGTMTVIISGRGIYKDTVKIPVKIVSTTEYVVSFNELVNPEDASANKVAYNKQGATVTGLTVRALDGNYILREGVDYKVRYKNNKAVNSVATLTIIGKNNYGTLNIPFTVVANELNEHSVYVTPAEIDADNLEKTRQKVQDGKMTEPVVVDAVTGKKLDAGKDFNYEYGAYDEKTKVFPVTLTAGTNGTYTGSVILDGIHVYKTKLKTSGSDANVGIRSDAKFYYTGQPITLEASDFLTGTGKAVLGKDFVIVGYSNNIMKGTAKVTIKGIGDYGGTVELKFYIQKATK